MLAPVLVTPPVELPVTLAEAKLHMQVDFADHDTLIDGFLRTATQYMDGWTGILGRALVTQTWRQDFPCYREASRLALKPVASISGIKYLDASNVEQTLPDTVYRVLEDTIGPYVALKPDQTWPSTYLRADAVSVTYVAGSTVDQVPRPIKTAIVMLAAHYYERRETASPDALTEIPFGVNVLLAPFRRVGV